MQVQFEIPDDVAQQYASDPASLPRQALEAFALEGVRSRRLSVAQARRLLGIGTRYEMDGFLKEHGVFLEITAEDIHRDAETAGAFSLR